MRIQLSSSSSSSSPASSIGTAAQLHGNDREISLMRSKLLGLVEDLPAKPFCSICERAGLESETVNFSKSNKKVRKECQEWEQNIFSRKRRVRCNDVEENGENGSTQRNVTDEGVESKQIQKKQKNQSSQKKTSFLSLTEAIFASAQPIDFDLPLDFLETQRLSLENKTVVKASPKRQRKKAKKAISQERTKIENEEAPALMCTIVDEDKDENNYHQFKATSARCMPYDIALKKSIRQSNNSAAHAAKSLAFMQNRGRGRKINRPAEKDNIDEKKNSSRAARASQRRRNKEISRLGLNQATDMTGREDVLRFGKSTIHGWGVFCDSFITGGDLIVEYRGILIGNTVADKREKEYERAKIGSDYMFRIDSETVCDATRHGNVARFINASCTPNCYTQIITVNGAKRIAIYAKRDIWAGEELSYDYKFQAEYDESKRIRK